jgi:hypothetical protein
LRVPIEARGRRLRASHITGRPEVI